MLIVSPKWVYLDNKKLENDKSLLIDSSIIIDVLSNNQIEKKYRGIKREYFDSHVIIPTFSECYLNVDDCLNEADYQEKISNLIANGVTRIQIVSKDIKKILKYNQNNVLFMSFALTLAASSYAQVDMKELTNILDFYKSDKTKTFSINLKNILLFPKDTIKKISSICNELNLNINIHTSEMIDSNETNVKEIISFWDDINLLNNCAIHDIVLHKKDWLKFFNKKNITIMIKYTELKNIDKIQYFLSLIEKGYKCVLVTNNETSFKFYELLKVISFISNKEEKLFDPLKIIDCVTLNTAIFFTDLHGREIIKKNGVASYNIFNFVKEKFLISSHNKPLLADLDNTSLSNVWSSGQIIDLNNETKY